MQAHKTVRIKKHSEDHIKYEIQRIFTASAQRLIRRPSANSVHPVEELEGGRHAAAL